MLFLQTKSVTPSMGERGWQISTLPTNAANMSVTGTFRRWHRSAISNTIFWISSILAGGLHYSDQLDSLLSFRYQSSQTSQKTNWHRESHRTANQDAMPFPLRTLNKCLCDLLVLGGVRRANASPPVSDSGTTAPGSLLCFVYSDPGQGSLFSYRLLRIAPHFFLSLT